MECRTELITILLAGLVLCKLARLLMTRKAFISLTSQSRRSF